MTLAKRNIALEVIVTEQYKWQLLGRLEHGPQRVELAQQQLEVQGRRCLADLENGDPAQTSAFRTCPERQKRMQEGIRTRLSDRLAMVRDLEPGSEHSHGMLDGFVEIRVGDNLNEKLEAAEIVVKDDLVVEMRHT